MTGKSPSREIYTHGHAPATLAQHGRRTAEEAAAFLLPELRPDMRLLDVGCGPGSITRGFAERLTRGEVIGMDLSAEALAAARADAAERGLRNLEYREGSVYKIPYPDAEFDVVYAHQVLQHLAEHRDAMTEMLRVLKPGGLIAARDVDWGTIAYAPRDDAIDMFIELHDRTWRSNGGEPCMGRRLKGLFHSMEVTDLRVSAAVWCYSVTEQTTAWGESYAARILTSPMGGRMVEYGYATRTDLEAMAAAFRSWAANPDAFWAFVQVAALARKPG